MASPGPLSFDPVFKAYPWGGRNLERHLGRSLPPGIVAESWEISDHPNGRTPVREGGLAGATLGDVIREWGVDLLGTHNREAAAEGRFPLLLKLLDAHQWLSVQVHPQDRYALARHGEPGKTEMWLVLHAEPDAELILGFNQPIDPATFGRAVADGTLERFLERVPVSAGDAFFVQPGTIHALGPGILVAEIQQNSDLTFRVYDWGRTDAEGRPRPLHVESALAVLDFGAIAPGPVDPVIEEQPSEGARAETLARCSYFHVERIQIEAGRGLSGACDGTTFEIWGVVSGNVRLEHPEGAPRQLSAVEWVLLPAALGEFTLSASPDERAELLRVTTPPGDGAARREEG